jgi:hypothetical protein
MERCDAVVEFRCRPSLHRSIRLPSDEHRREKASLPIGFALEAENPGDVGLFARETSLEDIRCEHFIRPQRFSCKGGDTNPAAYSTSWYDGGNTFSFKLDNAMAIIVGDDMTNEIAIDTWFMSRYTKHK